MENLDLDLVRKRVDADLEKAQAALQAAQGRVDELMTVREGLRIAAERYPDAMTASSPEPDLDDLAVIGRELSTPAPGTAGSAVNTSVATGLFEGVTDNGSGALLQMSQADACMVLLRSGGRPLSTREVYNRMQSSGRPENHEQVRSALTYLKRVNRIRRADHEWVINDAPAMPAAGATPDQ